MPNITISRAGFLGKLEAVSPGISTHGKLVEQSECFIFRGGLVQAFNEELATSIVSGLPKEIVGAVPAAKLTAMLAKLKEDEIDLDWGETELVIHGKNRRASGFRLEAEIMSGIDTVDQPDENSWKPLAEGFAEAITVVQECATNTSMFLTNVVHIAPKWIEAGDDTQLIRYRIRTGIETPTMVRQASIRNVAALGMTEFAETPSWLHFRNSQGLTCACRCYTDPPYPTEQVTAILKEEDQGQPMTLPKGLIEAAELAETATAGDKNVMVLLELRPGRLTLTATGLDGCWHREPKKVVYDGQPLSFLITPKLLKELVKKHNDVLISSDKLRVINEQFRYVTVLGVPDAVDQGDNGGSEE